MGDEIFKLAVEHRLTRLEALTVLNMLISAALNPKVLDVILRLFP